jgi:preprotein translocase subunit YajC
MFSLQNIPPAPSHQGSETAPSAPTSPAAPAHSPSLLESPQILMFAVMIPLLLLMFFSSRSQSKKQAAVVAALAKGDRVLLQGGLVGKLVELGDRYAKVEIAPGVKVDFLKNSLLGKDTPETAAQAEKK